MALLATLLDATLRYAGRDARSARGTLLVVIKDDGSVACSNLQRGTKADFWMGAAEPDVRLAGDTMRLEARQGGESLLVEGRIHTLVRLDETAFQEEEGEGEDAPVRLAFRAREPAPSPEGGDPEAPLTPEQQEVFEALRAWRLQVARAQGISAFIVAPDRTLRAIAREAPADVDALRAIPGFGPSRTEKYGREILAILHPGEA